MTYRKVPKNRYRSVKYPVLESFPVLRICLFYWDFVQPARQLSDGADANVNEAYAVRTAISCTHHDVPTQRPAVSSPARLPVLERCHEHCSTSHSRRGFPLQKEARH